jgi:hypothetical protein
MKKFILNSIIFILITAVLIQARPLYLLYKDKYKSIVANPEIYFAIYKSKQKKKAKKILLGDSVGYELFCNTTHNDTINSLACNQAIGMVGHFILLSNYLNSGNKVDTVFMIYRPFSFLNNLDKKFIYHCFLKPFYKDEYLPYFTETVNEQIHKIPYHNFCRFPLILTSNWAPDYNSEDEINYTFLSPISVEYLKKINELSIKHGFKFIIMSPPISLRCKPAIEKMNINEITKNDLGGVFGNYFMDIIYLNDTCFGDSIHLKTPQKYTEYYKENLMK